MTDDRARRLAVVVRRALMMIVAAIEAEFRLDAPDSGRRGTMGETK